MDLWKIIVLALLVGAVSVAFALTVTIVIHSIRWIFNQGRKSARKNSCPEGQGHRSRGRALSRLPS